MKAATRQIIFVICFIIAWQIIYSMKAFPEILFPSVPSIFEALKEGFAADDLMSMVLYSLSLILKGMLIGIILAFIFSSLAVVNRVFYDIYNLIVSIMDLIPGVALLPLAILWFGIGEITIIFIMIHSILWPMSRSIIDGFSSVSPIYIESGENIGLKGLGLVLGVYLPAAFTHVLTGLRVGWARAWRGLISVEMIFGTTGSGAGIGWYIYMRRAHIDIAGVLATLLVIILIGVIVEYGIFRTVEKNTVRKWGMVR